MTSLSRSAFIACLATLLLPCINNLFAQNSASSESTTTDRVAVDIESDAGKLTLSVDGQIAFVYRFDESVDLPHFDPFNSPSGRAMTVKITDPFPHHRSFWVADEGIQLEGQAGKVGIYNSLYSGVKDASKSKYPVAPYKQRVEHVEFSNVTTEGDTAEFDEQLTWKTGDVSLLDELRHYRIVALGEGEYFIDFSFRLTANYGKLTITRDPSHYAIPYFRMNDTFNVEKGGGKIVNSEGGVNQAGTTMKLAYWVDYTAPLPNSTGAEGMACFIHPSKKPPHLWLTRDYGTWGPRGADGFHATTFEIAERDAYTQRVGILVHNGDTKTAKIAERYKEYAEGEL